MLVTHFGGVRTKKDNCPIVRVKTVIVNPTKYFVRPYLTRYNYKDNTEEHEEFSGNAREENRTVVDGFNVLKDDAEFDQGKLDLIKYRLLKIRASFIFRHLQDSC